MFSQYDPDKNDFIEVNEPDSSLCYSYADYLKWKFEERVELIRGRMMKMTAPNRKHQEISGSVFHQLKTILKNYPCKVYAAPFDVRLTKKINSKNEDILTVVQPDISVICDETKLDDNGCIGAPDLVIEILSPGNSKKEVRLKYELYEENEVKEYWIIYPTEETIAVFVLNEHKKYNGATIYAGGDNLSSSVLNHTISISKIFN